MRIFFSIALVIVLVVLSLAGVGWYALHSPDRYLSPVIANLERKTGLQVQIGHLEIHLRPTLRVTAYRVRVKNPRPFPSGDVLNIPRLDADVEMMPLVQGTVEVRRLVLDHPAIDFISDPDGLWNFQDPSTSRQQPTRFTMGVIHDLQIKNGTLLGSNLIDPADTPGPVVLVLRNFSGQLREIDVRKVTRSGQSQTVEGRLDADRARFGSIHTRELHTRLRITPKQLTFKGFALRTQSGRAHGDFSFNFGAKNTTFHTELQVNGVGMPYLLAQFQPGPPKMTGTLEAKFKLAGDITHSSNPLAGIHGGGRFTIRNGELPSLNSNKNMVQMKRFRDPGTAALPASAFSTFAGDIDLKSQRMYSNRLGVNFYGIDVDGHGSTSVVGAGMDYRGLATIQTKQGFFIDLFASWFKGAHVKNGRLTFPIRLTGTMADPKFVMAH
ncbi:MAG: AsmA family protein [Acidobacteriaceae bacterium]